MNKYFIVIIAIAFGLMIGNSAYALKGNITQLGNGVYDFTTNEDIYCVLHVDGHKNTLWCEDK